MTATYMENQRKYKRLHGRRQSPESRKKSNRKYRIASYGLTQDDFNLLFENPGICLWDVPRAV